MCNENRESFAFELRSKATNTFDECSSQSREERGEFVLCCEFAKSLNLVTEMGEGRILIKARTCFLGKLVERLKTTCESLTILREAVETSPEILGSLGICDLTEIVGTESAEGRKDEAAEGNNLAPGLKRFDAHSLRLVSWNWCQCIDDDQDTARSAMNKPLTQCLDHIVSRHGD